MKKIVSLVLTIVMMFSFCNVALAVDTLENCICFTWAWGANKIETDNQLTVVSWSGGANSSYRSGFIVYDLPTDFVYESEKSEVILSFAINKATLNNGDTQAPTAAVVMVDGDKVKEAYGLKSGSNATKLLNEAKNNGVLLGNYKIGKYPRTSRIKNACVNEFFEKNPNVTSIGFYVTNIAADGYSGTVNGIASGMSQFEVNFNCYGNYKNVTVNMYDDKGSLLKSENERGCIGDVIDIPEKIEKDGIVWVRDEKDYRFEEGTDEIEITYKDDRGGREKYVEVIEKIVFEKVKNPVNEKIDLPTTYETDDGFVIEIEWVSDNENVLSNDGNVFCGTNVQTAQLYGKMKIGKYTYVQTKNFTVTVLPLDENETDENLVYEQNFDKEKDKRGSFCGEKTALGVTLPEEYTMSLFVRVDDLNYGGEIFSVGDMKCEIENGCVFGKKITEGRWYHIAITNSAIYIGGEKICDNDFIAKNDEVAIGGYCGKADNLKIFKKAFSQSVIKSLGEEKYDSPKIEIVSSSVIEGLDSVIVKVNSNGFSGEGTVLVKSEKDNVTRSARTTKEIESDVTVFSVNVPNMGGELSIDNTTVLLWDTLESMNPLGEKIYPDKKYDFGFDREHPDCHMLSNTFTLKDKEKNLYLTNDGVSQRTDGAKWRAEFVNGVNREGYYTLVNDNGKKIDGNFVFEYVENNVYKIKNADTGEYISRGGTDEWMMEICSYSDLTKVFSSEGFFLLDEKTRESIYSVTGQPLWQSMMRREKLSDMVNGGYFDLDGEAQKEKLAEITTYWPSYQINAAVNKNTTGVEVRYTLSDITKTSYSDRENNSKSGYGATVKYFYDEGEVDVRIYARSQSVVKNIAKGFSYMPYQFINPLEKVTDYYATNNQFKAETGEIFIETNYEVSSENVAVTGAHELGHLIDFALFRLSVGDYKNARDTECALSGYGQTALGEDFAEFCQAVISSCGDSEKLRCLKAMYKGRFDALCDGMCSYYGKCVLKEKLSK